MQRFITSTSLCLLAFTLLLASASSSAQAQDLFFPETPDFSSVTTGTIVCENFESLVDFNGDLVPTEVPTGLSTSEVLIPSPQTITLGQFSSDTDVLESNLLDLDESDFGGTVLTAGSVLSAITWESPFDAPTSLVVELDPALGKLEAFRMNFSGSDNTVSFFDGDVLVDTFSVRDEGIEITSLDNVVGSVDWFNTEMSNVTRIEFTAPGTGVLVELKASFLPCPEPPAETCFDQLTDARTEVEALLATATGRDEYLLGCVLGCIDWTQHDCFWVQPSGDRLTAYGSNVFLGTAYSIAYLERVSDPQSDVIIDQLLATLECLVDREIEYAIANGGRQANIDKAMDFADLADVIDDEFDNQVVASLAYKLAWVNAYYATY